MTSRTRQLLSGLTVLCLCACGAGAAMRAEHAALLARPEKPGGVHLRLHVDHAQLARVTDALLARAPLKLELAMPPLGVGQLSVRALSLSPDAAPPSRDVRLALRIDVETPLGTIRNLALHATAPLEGLVEGAHLLVGPRLSQAHKVGVTWPDKWRDQVITWLTQRIPGGVLRALAQAAAGPVLQKLSDLVVLGATKLAGLAWRSLDAHLRVKVKLPRIAGKTLPLRSVAVRTGATAIEVDIGTALSAHAAPLDAGPAQKAPVRITLAGPVVGALLHEAMRAGALPTRYNTSAKPDPKGNCRLAFGWDEATGDLRVHVFVLGSPAGRITLGGPLRAELFAPAATPATATGPASPSAAGTPKTKLRLSAKGMRIIENRGDFLFELGVWLGAELWGRTFKFMRDLVVPEEVAVGQVSVRPALRAVHFTKGAVHVDLEPDITFNTPTPDTEK